jgi:aspartyl protease
MMCAPRHLPLCLVVLVAPSAAQAPERARTAPELVAAARQALGWNVLAAGKGALRVEGPARFLGTDATQTLVFDGHGRFAQRFDGPLSQLEVCDGRRAWTRDWTDTSRELVLGDLAEAQLAALLTTGGWTAAGEGLAFELAEPDAADELALAFAHPDGVLRGTLALDAGTLRARRATTGDGESFTSWSFDDYREHEGLWFPHRIEFQRGGMGQAFEARSVARLPAPLPAHVEAELAPPLTPPDDVRFDPETPAELEVKRVASGHLLVHPTIDGEDLGWFIFDSGAGINCIANDVTEALPEGPFGEIGARGIGGTVPARFWRAGELRLGPVRVEHPLFMGLDLAFLEPHFGVHVAGILGFEFLARVVAELDMAAGSIALHDPARYTLPEDGRWEEVLLHTRHPCVRASLEGREGIFKIDTGAANDTVTLHYPAVQLLDLLKGRTTRAGSAGGVGGFVKTSVGELSSFRLGGHEFSPLQASFALEDKGAFADAYVWGSVGGKLLEPFRLVFDYPGRRLGFVPRAGR